jgi:leucine dehydrogenase
LVEFLVSEGVHVGVADIDKEKVKALTTRFKDLKVLDVNEIVTAECDIFAPCALGAVINDQTVAQLKCKIVCGGANNQLAEARHGDALREMGILYAPDFVANAGGLMNVFVELEGYSSDRAFDKTKRVYENLMRVFQMAESERISTHLAADRIAEARLSKIAGLRSHHQGRMARPYSTLKEMVLRS